jgi:hypothetical protein
MWADPCPDETAKKIDFIENEDRECSYFFG